MDSFDFDNDLIRIMYMQEQLQVAYAAFLQQEDKYRYLKLAVDTLFEDVKAFYSKHERENVGADMADVYDSLNDDALGYVQQDCELAIDCIDIINNYTKDNHLEDKILLNIDLSSMRQDDAPIQLMPCDMESRIKWEEYDDPEYMMGIKHLGLRFVSVVMPRTKYFNMLGSLEDAKKRMKYTSGGAQFDLNNPGEKEKQVVRSGFEYTLLYEMLTYKHPDSDTYDFMNNIDVALHYLEKLLSSDYYVSNETMKGYVPDDVLRLSKRDDVSGQIKQAFDDYYKSLEDQQEVTPEHNDEIEEDTPELEEEGSAWDHLHSQEYLEDICAFNMVLKSELDKFFKKYSYDSIGTSDYVVELSDMLMEKIKNVLDIDYPTFDGMIDYANGQEDNIDDYLSDLYFEIDLTNAIKTYYSDICNLDSCRLYTTSMYNA